MNLRHDPVSRAIIINRWCIRPGANRLLKYQEQLSCKYLEKAGENSWPEGAVDEFQDGLECDIKQVAINKHHCIASIAHSVTKEPLYFIIDIEGLKFL